MSDGKIVYFTPRREAQLNKNDPVVILADELIQFLVSHEDVDPANYFIAIDLAARAIAEIIRRKYGDAEFNAIALEIQKKARQYFVNLPSHDEGESNDEEENEKDGA